MNNVKPKGLIISGLVAIVVFVVLLFVQKSILKPNGTVDGLIAIGDIQKGTIITEQNVDSLFKEKVIDGELQTSNSAKTKSELINQIVKDGVNKGEVISLNSFIEKESILAKIDNPVETSFNVSNIAQVVGGILREGDLIDISVIDSNTGESTVVLTNVYITKAISSDGVEIDRSSDLSAITINILISQADENILNNNINNGEIRVSKKN